ncbi:MAG TPA: ABC transporter permease, partial [Kineosporiaceae bacterium]|nr:ABC transporter permease [Kineosporiaceae bacterium]
MTAVQERAGTALAPPARPALTDRARHERRLGWILSAPAVIVMLFVTAYPMLNALYLSLFEYRLTDPNNQRFVGLSNYWIVLKDPIWWQDVGTTA